MPCSLLSCNITPPRASCDVILLFLVPLLLPAVRYSCSPSTQSDSVCFMSANPRDSRAVVCSFRSLID